MKPGFGPPTLVVARYALAGLCASRLFVAFLVFCCLPALALLVLVFVRHNTEGSGLLEFVEAVLSQLLPLNIWLVDAVRPPSLAAAFLVVLVAGPALVAPDMRGNAMPLYLSRPLGKLDYVVGKLLALLALALAVGWLPGVLVFVAQSCFLGLDWMREHVRFPFALGAVCLVWAACLGMIALALSAWVKWRPAATLGFLGVYYATKVAGGVLGEIVGDAGAVWVGSLLSFSDAIDTVDDWLHGGNSLDDDGPPMPVPAAWCVLGASAALAALVLLRRIRANEVAS